MGIPPDIPNWIIYIYIYGEQLGGRTYSKNRDSIQISIERLPPDITKWSSSGILRIREEPPDSVTIFFPYPFLIEFLKGKINLIRKQDLEELFFQLRSRFFDAKTGKGYTFQLALGLELLSSKSMLMRHILNKFGTDYTPSKYFAGLALFKSDDEAQKLLAENYIGVSIDPGTERKTGDLVFKVIASNII